MCMPVFPLRQCVLGQAHAHTPRPLTQHSQEQIEAPRSRQGPRSPVTPMLTSQGCWVGRQPHQLALQLLTSHAGPVQAPGLGPASFTRDPACTLRCSLPVSCPGPTHKITFCPTPSASKATKAHLWAGSRDCSLNTTWGPPRGSTDAFHNLGQQEEIRAGLFLKTSFPVESGAWGQSLGVQRTPGCRGGAPSANSCSAWCALRSEQGCLPLGLSFPICTARPL